MPTETDQPLDPDRTAVLVIDMQNDFVHENGSLTAPGAEAQIPTIRRVTESCHGHDVPVIYTKVIWDSADDVPRPLQRGMPEKFADVEGQEILQRGSFGAQLHEGLAPTEQDYVVEKQYFDACQGTDLDEVLAELAADRGTPIEHLAFTGTTVNNCVYSTMLGTAHRGYLPVAIRDCISGFRDTDLEFFLEYQMPKFLGAEVMTAASFESAIEARASPQSPQ